MRIDEIRYTRTLDYSDGIAVFEASDAIGGSYVASYLEDVEGGDKYLVVGCRPESLRLFRHGACDLRELLTQSAAHGWYVADFLGTKRPLVVREVGSGAIPDEYLPESGYMILDSEVDHEVVTDAVERNNFVLQISIEPSGMGRGHAVGIRTFNNLMRYIQELAWSAAEEVTESRRSRNTSRLEVVKISEAPLS